MLAEGPVVALSAALAVYALRVVLAVLAHAPALVAAVDVDAELAGLHLRVVQTLAGVAVALAGLALELVALLVGPPLFLDEARAAGLALVTAGVVRTAADELVGHVRVGLVAHLGMAVADAAAADRNVSDAIEILWRKRHRVS